MSITKIESTFQSRVNYGESESEHVTRNSNNYKSPDSD